MALWLKFKNEPLTEQSSQKRCDEYVDDVGRQMQLFERQGFYLPCEPWTTCTHSSVNFVTTTHPKSLVGYRQDSDPRSGSEPMIRFPSEWNRSKRALDFLRKTSGFWTGHSEIIAASI
jgi:hypothetical protein